MKSGNKTLTAAFLGALIAATAASSCCILPMVFALLGVGSLGIAAAVAPYRSLLIAIAYILLACAFYFVYRKGPRCATGSTCSDKSTKKGTKIALWVILVAVTAAVSFPWWFGFFV